MKIPDDPLQDQFFYLRRRFRSRYRRSVGPIEVVALVNVALLICLFIFFTSSFVIQPGIMVTLPPSPFVGGIPHGAMVVTISQEGMIFFNDERTPMSGLDAAFAQLAHAHPEETLLIEADGSVRHHTLVEIYNKALQAGIKNVALATRLAPTPAAP